MSPKRSEEYVSRLSSMAGINPMAKEFTPNFGGDDGYGGGGMFADGVYQSGEFAANQRTDRRVKRKRESSEISKTFDEENESIASCRPPCVLLPLIFFLSSPFS